MSSSRSQAPGRRLLWTALATGALACADMGRWLEPDAAAADAAGEEPSVPADGVGDGPAPTGIVRFAVMRDLRFVDEEGAPLAPIPCRRGDLIRFRNDEPTPVRHQVRDGSPDMPSPALLFQSELLDPGQTFDYLVAAPPGRFVFFCTTHPATMRDAEVFVE